MQYWASRALQVLRQQIVLANVVAKDINFGEVGWQGKSITVPYPGTFTAVDKTAGTPLTPQAPTGGASITLTLNKHKSVPMAIEDFASAQANQSLMDRYIEPAVIALVEQFELDLWMTALGASSVAPIGTIGTAITSSGVVNAMTTLHGQKAPMTNRSMVVSAANQGSLITDSSLQYYFAQNQPGAVTEGQFGRAYGFDFYWSQFAPLAYKQVVGSAAFTMTFNGQTTGSISNSGVTAATVQSNLAGLSSVGAGQVAVSGPTGGPFVVTFTPTIDATGTLTVTGTGSSVTRGQANVALHRDAIMLAVRPFEATPAGTGVLSAQANDPESGLSLRIMSQYDINNEAMRVNLDLLYGTVALRPTQGVVVLS